MRGRGLPRTGGECMCGVCDKVCVNMIVHVEVYLHLEILFSVRPCKNVQGICLHPAWSLFICTVKDLYQMCILFGICQIINW